MKAITTKDLRESLTLLLPQKQEDGEGGWQEHWVKGPRLWASLWPIIVGNGFHNADKGGPMAAQQGYLQTLAPAYYRIIIRAGITLPAKTRFLWHLRQKTKRLLVVNTPVLIQYNHFLCMTVVEEGDA